MKARAGGIWFRPTFFPSPAETVLRYTLAPALTKDLRVTIQPVDSKDPAATQTDSSLKSISSNGVLRVGYNPHVNRESRRSHAGICGTRSPREYRKGPRRKDCRTADER